MSHGIFLRLNPPIGSKSTSIHRWKGLRFVFSTV